MAASKSLAGLDESSFARALREKKTHETTVRRRDHDVANLMTVVENYLIVWEATDCCLMIKNLWSAGPTVNDSYLSLSLTDPPVFDVDDIEASLDGTHVLLSGPQGVACVELPSGWTGSDSAKPAVDKIARSFYIGEQQLLCTSRLRVQQAKWYPGSPSNSHVMILTSDNHLRIYDIGQPNRPEMATAIGPHANQSARWLSTTTFSSCLDDVAVSFDFGLPCERTDARRRDATETKPVFQWPVYVLFGNGHVYSLLSSLGCQRSVKESVRGPLAMWPAADDNYGSDACALLCLAVSPPVLVVARQQGCIHHALLLPRAQDQELDDRHLNMPDDLQSLLSWASITSVEPRAHADGILYVTETLELDADLLEDNSFDADAADKVQDEDEEGSTTLRLRRDPSCCSRYFVSHDYGVHVAQVPLVNKLWQLASLADGDVDAEETTRAVAEESVVEFVLCTRTKGSPASAPRGVVLHALPPTLFVLLSSAHIHTVALSLLLKPALQPAPDAAKDGNDDADVESKAPRESFENQIRQVLQRNHSQPRLSLMSGTDLPVPEVIKLFSRCVEILREEYIMKQDMVREMLEKRSRLLEIHRQQQLDELNLILKSRADLSDTAHALAEKYEDAKETQERFVQRVEKVLYEIQRRSPVVSEAEKQMHGQMRHFESRLHKIRQNLEVLRRREQLYPNKVPSSSVPPTGGHLNEQQIASLNEILTKQSEDIEALTKSVQFVRKQVGM